jgi:predicted alpha/beta superfamily hydrolase
MTSLWLSNFLFLEKTSKTESFVKRIHIFLSSGSQEVQTSALRLVGVLVLHSNMAEGITQRNGASVLA